MPVHANAARPNAVLTAAFFLPLALIPWLNPFAGGAMTPAIPLLVGWSCTALLFAGLPARRLSPWAGAALAALAAAVLAGLLLGRPWQLLALGLLMIGAAAAVGARLAQDFAENPDPHDAVPAADAGGKQSGIELIAWAWLLAGLLNALIGLLQYRQHTAWLGQWVNHAPVGQVYGNLRQRNQLATLLCMALWALWYLWRQGALMRALQWLAGRVPQWLGTALAWLLMLPLAAVLALTLSRTGLVQLGLSIVLLAFWTWQQQELRKLPAGPAVVSRKQVLVWLAGVLAVYLAVTYVLPHLYGGVDMLARLEGTDSRACISRKVLWGNVWQLIAQKPWGGWGWGELDYAHYHASYPGLRFCSLLDHAHNLPLHLAVELGVPVAVLACGLAAWWALRQRPWAETNPARQLMWGVLALIGLHSLLEYPLWYAHFQQAFGLALGALWATQPAIAGRSAATSRLSRSPAIPEHAARRWQGMLALGLLTGMAYSSFDFVRVTQLYMAADDRVWPFRQHTRQQAERSVLYRNAVQFAAVSTDPVTPEKAEQQLAQARRLMHYSPESRVVIRIIECLQALGLQAEADAEIAHFQQVYPKEYERWRNSHQP